MGLEMNKSKLHERMTAALLIIFIGLFSVFPLSVHAADGGTNPLRLTISQVFTASGDVADIGTGSDSFTYRLSPVTEGIPMPQDSTTEGYIFDIKGTSSVELAPIHFPDPGFFRYEISQVISAEKSGYTYDKQIYMLEVQVDNEGGAWIAAKNEAGYKAAEISFVNRYYKKPVQTDNGGDTSLVQEGARRQNTTAGANLLSPAQGAADDAVPERPSYANIGEIVSDIIRGDLPLGSVLSEEGWSLLSAILSIVSLIVVLLRVLRALFRRRREEESDVSFEQGWEIEADVSANQRAAEITKRISLLTFIFGILTAIVWIILDWPLHSKAIWINHSTPVVALVFVIHIALLFTSSRIAKSMSGMPAQEL